MSAKALAELRALRASGKKRLDTYEIQDQGAVYDEIDEDGYKKVVRSRLDRDDFVVDDNGDGYADDGREEWQTEQHYYSSEEEDNAPMRSNAGKRKREEEQERIEKSNKSIANYFSSGPAPASKPKVFCSHSRFNCLLTLNSKSMPPLRRIISWPGF